MHASARHALPQRLHVLASLAHLLERLERFPRSASADQYRTLCRRLTQLLRDAEPDEHLRALLQAYPATAELYENLRYEHAGLCQSNFDESLNAELSAVAALEHARKLRAP